MLQLKDTEQHPDVIAQKKLIEALKRSREGARLQTAPPARPTAPQALASARCPTRSMSSSRYGWSEADTAVASLQRQRAAEAELLRSAGEGAARAAGPGGRVPEHGPRLQRAAQELRGTAQSPAVRQPCPGRRYPGRQGQAADRRSARDAAAAGHAKPASAGVRRPASRELAVESPSPSCSANSTGLSRRSISSANLGCRCWAASRSLVSRPCCNACWLSPVSVRLSSPWSACTGD